MSGQCLHRPDASRIVDGGPVGMLVIGMAADAYFRGLGDGGGVLTL